MTTLRLPTAGPQADSDAGSRGVTSLGPPALSQRERGQNRVTIEAVLRREATVGDFVAGRFETRQTAPGGAAALALRLRRILGGLLRSWPGSIVRRGPHTVTSRGSHSESFFDDGFGQQRLTITYYYPWGYFHPVRSGAAAIASRQLDYFRQRGHRVRMMVRAAPHRGRAAFERHYHWVDEIAVVDVGKYPAIQRYFDTWDFGNYLAGHARLAEQPEIGEWLSQPADVAFLNYVFATPLLDALPAGAYRLLETYDIMSHQFLGHRSPSALLDQSLAGEFDLYRLYDSVLMINQDEEEFARSHCAADLAYLPPSIEVAHENSERPDGAPYDLLFVGSGHSPNVEGVDWFYRHVYRPLLKVKGIRWAISGSVCRQLPFKDPGVIRLGSVADLGELYRRSKVVVVPLFRGSGISIKTLEAMGHRKPVVTTPCGRRGLSASADNALLTYPFEVDPAAVADAIGRLCSSDALRKDYGRRAALFISDHFSTRSYVRRMDHIFQRVVASDAAREPFSRPIL
ncbi:MAG TPA: glycosyltransferase [Pirellulales bacterium]|jgi:glycosyltransferase involved in cell wall biosynthesis|nr:glycosyltransferase [Pirellulales bacterium]